MARKEAWHSLEGLNIFEDLDEADRLSLEEHCRWQTAKAGQKLFEQGEDTSDIYFVIEGTANIVDFSLSGREVAFSQVEAGESFGELASIDGKTRSASVIASTDCKLAVLPSEPFLELLQRRVQTTFRVLQRLAEVVRLSDRRIMELSTLAANHRVYAEILRMAQPDAAVPGLWIVRPLPPLREIASRVSTSRETVARALGQLYPSGLLRRKGRNLYVMDRDALQEIIYALNLDEKGTATTSE